MQLVKRIDFSKGLDIGASIQQTQLAMVKRITKQADKIFIPENIYPQYPPIWNHRLYQGLLKLEQQSSVPNALARINHDVGVPNVDNPANVPPDRNNDLRSRVHNEVKEVLQPQIPEVISTNLQALVMLHKINWP